MTFEQATKTYSSEDSSMPLNSPYMLVSTTGRPKTKISQMMLIPRKNVNTFSLYKNTFGF